MKIESEASRKRNVVTRYKESDTVSTAGINGQKNS
jgi:hypothetical protein